jgi:hypothetical protein
MKNFYPVVSMGLLLYLGTGNALYSQQAPPAQPANPEDQLRLLEEEEGTIEFNSDLPGAKAEPAAAAEEKSHSLSGHVSSRVGVSVGRDKAWQNEIAENRSRLKMIFSKNGDHAGFYGAGSFFYFGRSAFNRLDRDYRTDTKDVLNQFYYTNKRNFQMELHQAYVSFYTKYMDLTIGRQVIKWGASDAPTDTLNPNALVSAADSRNAFSGELEDSLMGVDSLKSEFYLGVVDVEAVVVPMFQRFRFPAPRSFWGNPLERSVVVPRTYIPLKGKVEGADEDDYLEVVKGRLGIPARSIGVRNLVPSPSLNNISGGLGIKRTIFNQDLSAYYFHSQERIPIMVTRAKILGNLDTTTREFKTERIKSVNLRFKYPNTDSFGLASAGSFWKLGYRFDINYSYQREFLLQEFTGLRADIVDVPDFEDEVFDGDWDVTVRQKTVFLDQLAYAFGVNFDLPGNFKMWLDYYGRQILGYRKDLIAMERQDIVAPRLQRSFLREELFLRLQSLFVLQTLDTLFRPEIEYRFTQSAQFYLGAVVLLGEKRQALSLRDLNLGPMVQKDMVYVMGRYNF